MERLSVEEKKRRKAYVEEALANARLEGYRARQVEIDVWTEYVNGQRTLEQAVARLQQMALEDKD